MGRPIHTYHAAGFLAPGTRFGNYELIRGIAIGGMADLYLASTLSSRAPARRVALKRILPRFAAQPEYVAMFLAEARLLASLSHTNIARLYEIGHAALGLFFTMEYVEGCDARQLLRRLTERERALPLAHAIAIVMATAAGLHAAHEHRAPDGTALRIVHRDVSPANVLLGYDGAVKLVDFGIAKSAHGRFETRDGTVKGKLAYMSPEQCLGHQVDRRSDVFSLGILLYELTTCARLFAAPTEYATMDKIAHRPITPPTVIRRDYPPELEHIVMRALTRDPDARWPTAQALAGALNEFGAGRGLSSSPVELGAFVAHVCDADLGGALA